MAALDFPAAPTVGQTWGAPNGVIYRWSGTLWAAVGNISPSPGGDVMATRAAAYNLTGSYTALICDTIALGNAGSWYNTVTGRYTPPAGRYNIRCSGNSFNGGGTGGSVQCQLRKNGVMISDSAPTTMAGMAQDFECEALADASGTDYFEVLALTGASQGQITRLSFFAFPISGLKGPPGDPGQLGFRLLSRQVLSVASPYLEFAAIPSDINDLRISWNINCVTNGQDVVMRVLDTAGVPDTGANYGSALTVAAHNQAVGTAPAVAGNGNAAVNSPASILMTYSVSNRRVWNNAAGGGYRGNGTINDIRNPASVKSLDFMANYVSDDGLMYLAITGSGYNNQARVLGGLRLFFGSANMAAGSTMSVWGSP
jgi:hypothetical protein